jgi:methionine-rich copper-binding protein CopC
MHRFSAVAQAPSFVCGLVGGMAAACGLFLAGCTGSGEGLDNSGRPLGEAAQLPLVAEFDSIQAHVFTPICTACHAGATAPEGLRLDAANSYNLLVDMASTQSPSTLRVAPGNPGASYIIQKLEGTAAFGERMPFDGPYLPASTVAVIRQWIAEGALRSPAAVATAMTSAMAAATSGPATGASGFAVSTAAPAEGDVLQAAPAQVVIGFNRELDTTRVPLADIRLERFDPGDPGAPAMVVPAAVSVPPANTRALLVTPAAPLAQGHYRLVIADPYGVGLADLDGRLLASAPGTNDVVTRFTVGSPQ